ncbi:hypothetical protein AC629_08350 [Bradyrhizobium sp. NAS80.1]|nr:hypothetical protein AC629_08350 [Bradyrhizobium sp. NAS80.1]
MFSAKLFSCFLMLRLLWMMRIYAVILPSFLLLLISGNDEVGSWQMPRLGSDRGTVPIFDDHEIIKSHPVQPKITVASTDTERRMTEETYAKTNGLSPDAVGSRFAASGVLRCPGGDSSAQVTGARDVITTAAHAFREVCKPPTSPDKCRFEYYLGAERRTIPLSAGLWMGTCFDSGSRAVVGD